LANPIPVRWVRPADTPAPDPHEFALGLLREHGRLRSEPGAKASYSNLGYIALGEVVAAASGRGFEQFVRDSILEPLRMGATGFSYDGLGADVATGYQPRLSPMTPLFRLLLPKGIVGSRSGRFLSFNRFYVDGAAYGGLVGSARDAARFLSAHLNGGELDGARVLSEVSARAMREIHARGRRLEVGFGWNRRGRHPSPSHLEHLGGGGGFWTMMRILPERGAGVVTMGNATRYDHESIAAAALGGAQS
jgi:CubicO group peptidase (beta-lactamase class C family)